MENLPTRFAIGVALGGVTYLFLGSVYTRPEEFVFLAGEQTGIRQQIVQLILSLIAGVLPLILDRFPWLREAIDESRSIDSQVIHSRIDRLDDRVTHLERSRLGISISNTGRGDQ